MLQLELRLQACQGAPNGWASLQNPPQVPSWGQEVPGGGQAGPHKPLASLAQPQLHLGEGVTG